MSGQTVERRYTPVVVELRGAGDVPRIGGYAAVFNKLSGNLGGFVERVAPSFFNKSRGDGWPDVMARYNHDSMYLLGTTGANTLRLEVDDVGLVYEVTPPPSRRDVVDLVERGDVRKSSFAWTIEGTVDDWDVTDQGFPRRTLISGQLRDVAPVIEPAYEDTTSDVRTVALRSLAVKVDADIEEVLAAAAANELRRFFVRTDGGGAPKPNTFGASAVAELLANRPD